MARVPKVATGTYNGEQFIDQLIGDIQDNEWYCIQGGSECELEDWEKNLIIIGLRKLLED